MTRRLGTERRRVARIPVNASSPVSVVGARLLDVSSYAMRIESPVALDDGAVMRFRLVVAGEKADVDAKVVNCVPSWRGSRRVYEAGLEFQGLAPAFRERLTETLRSLLLLTEAPKPMPDFSERPWMTFSSPSNAPPQMNRMLVVSICRKS